LWICEGSERAKRPVSKENVLSWWEAASERAVSKENVLSWWEAASERAVSKENVLSWWEAASERAVWEDLLTMMPEKRTSVSAHVLSK
jgi:hypothetical protein